MYRLIALYALVVVAQSAIAESTIREEQDVILSVNNTYAPEMPAGWEYISNKYDRFPNGGNTSTSFIYYNVDWSGTGHRRLEYQHVTMITPKFGITAWHTIGGFPNGNWEFRFYKGTVRSDTATHSSVLDMVDKRQASTGDVAVIEFNNPLGSDHATYPVFLRMTKSTPHDTYKGLTMAMFGQSATPPNASHITNQIYPDGNSYDDEVPFSQKFGNNKVDSGILGLGTRNLKFLFDETSNDAEFFPRLDTSGGGIFRLIGNKPTLVAIHGASFRDVDSSWYTPSIDTQSPKNESLWVLHDQIMPIDNGSHVSADVVSHTKSDLNSDIAAMQTGASHLKDRVVYYTENLANNNIKGDFNGNFYRDADDIDLLNREAHKQATANRAYNWYLDWDGDGDIDNDDVVALVEDPQAFNADFGDINFSGSVNIGDLIVALSNLDEAGGYEDGDVNGDGQITNADILIIDDLL